MHLVNKTACSYTYFLAQEQHEFVYHTQKLIIKVFNVIPEFKSSKLDHSKDNNTNTKDYINSKNVHISLNYF